MLGHYAQDIRELGTPDGYSTETLEHLHIMYVKIPWRMSNRRDPLLQMVEYVRRLEALEIQRVYIEEVYGDVLTFDVRDVEFDDEEDSAVEEETDDNNEAEGDEDEEEDDELEDGVEVGSAKQVESEIVFYPRPVTSIARRPTVRSVPARVIASSYGASDFLPALQRFLTNITPRPDHSLLLLPSDEFPLWHKAILNHIPLPFAPHQPCHRDVLRVRPPIRDTAGRISRAGVYDTALFTVDRSATGLQRFRAGHIHAIFSLPPHLVHLYSDPLVYLDVFKPFVPDTSSTHCLYATAPQRSGASLVVPLTSLRLACHLAPDFSSPLVWAHPSGSPSAVLTNTRSLFNEYYNHHLFLLMGYWRRAACPE
ncbi:hypothetical protein FRC12_020674 [Ceratobasidium sp. 428]|nr:hypothetical protein FRC12_020674 [Ceratobasidium sp. 428]